MKKEANYWIVLHKMIMIVYGLRVRYMGYMLSCYRKALLFNLAITFSCLADVGLCLPY